MSPVDLRTGYLVQIATSVREIDAWFEERDEQYWFAADLLDFFEPISQN